jgi:surface polysaccharide O-acyltransferase-like enzyme
MLGWATFLTGTASHLWFLPFALLASALICPLGRWLQERQMPGTLVVGMAVIVGVLVACTPCPVQVDATGNPVTYFFGMSWAALPAAMFGIALASLSTLISREAACCAGFAGLLLLFVLPVRFGTPSFFQTLIHNLGGIVLWLLAQAPLPRSASTLFCSLGSLSFGIYLIHLGWVEAGQALFDRMGVGVSLARDLAVIASSLVASVLCAIVGRRILWLRPLF